EPWTPEPQPERQPDRHPEREPVPAPVAGEEPLAATATTATPTGRDLHALLESGIAGISRLQSESEERAVAPRRAAPGNGDAAADTVPIDALLYRGRAALGRAIELRDEIRREGGAPSSEQLDELFDLLDLAALP
ncbi:MAG TPA: hypothetical protein VF048_03990, partial [Gemmatimonadaceae bacterium]